MPTRNEYRTRRGVARSAPYVSSFLTSASATTASMAEKAESFKIGKATTLDGRAAAWEELAAAAGGEIAALREAAAHRLDTERKLANRLIVRELFARSDAAAAIEHAPREASHVALAKEETGRRDAENLRELLRLRAQHPAPSGPSSP
jgi:hypothetical protein